ncbi:hypothetical protein ACHAW5_001059 [Stephanodiscus triporus]|uniref:AB hydrolase-1 domain-containing protein n=1 Tax=Stephanodiscus triporus TaxID=2934178 RepID=A0ABD3PP38_9STRA
MERSIAKVLAVVVVVVAVTSTMGVSAFVVLPAAASLPASSSSSDVASPLRRDRRLRSTSSSSSSSSTHPTIEVDETTIMPSHSLATSLPNLVYDWRGYKIRYQVSGPRDADRTVLLVHGLFVNSDHWRKALSGLNDLDAAGNSAEEDERKGGVGGGGGGGGGKVKAKKTVRVYALDLLGSGWSSKPNRDDPNARSANGENGRFLDDDTTCYRERSMSAMETSSSKKKKRKRRTSPILENVPLGTSYGGHRLAPKLELRHPLRSPYNFYTWAEQIADFTRDVVLASDDDDVVVERRGDGRVTLVANSIGTMSSLQSMIDEPDLYDGIMIVNPNFRELHSAEVPFSSLVMPFVRYVQSTLRNNGKGLFRSLATPSTVKRILMEPYAVHDVIDDELVTSLLDPLLTNGADDVVFDTLSYSAGPLPEQQLGSDDFPRDRPVWVVYGKDDPWTPSRRVENLGRVCVRPSGGIGENGPVERIVGLDGAGHCPHDEVPDEVNGLILEFLDRLDGL